METTGKKREQVKTEEDTENKGKRIRNMNTSGRAKQKKAGTRNELGRKN